MKTLEQVQAEMKYGEVFTVEEFSDAVENGYFIPYDGIGRFHDGENETNISVWSDFTPEEVKNYPYVCWYNR